MPEPRIEDLEGAAALHWQAPETERLGDWLLRAAEGFTGRANSALPVGDPGARRVLLQVETGNASARALYVRCGFRDSHRYHYLIAPPAS